MGLKSYLQSRRDDAELGKGIWRRSHDRFIRGIDRFHQVLERLAGTELNRALSKAGNAVALCAEALAMARCFGECTTGCDRQVSVHRRVETVVQHVQEAERLIRRAQKEAAGELTFDDGIPVGRTELVEA